MSKNVCVGYHTEIVMQICCREKKLSNVVVEWKDEKKSLKE